MNVADVRENVVLDLMVQSACVPVDQPVFRGKIYSREQLVDGPCIFDFAVFVRNRISSLIDHVGELEHDAQDEPGRDLSFQAGVPLPGRYRQRRTEH